LLINSTNQSISPDGFWAPILGIALGEVARLVIKLLGVVDRRARDAEVLGDVDGPVSGQNARDDFLPQFRHFARSSDDAAADFNKQGRKIFFKTNAT
jgi:hypothetical protein